MRLIDADALKKALKEHFSDEDDDVELIEIGACWYHGAVLEKIDNAPTVDAVEVVRCKDCKWQQNSGENGWCDRAIIGGDEMSCVDAKDNDFCSYAERKDK